MAEEKECCCSHKTKERSEKEYKDMIHRLNRIEGQIRGIKGMVERDAYCTDILVQVAAVNAALNSFNKVLLANHIKTCVTNDIREGRGGDRRRTGDGAPEIDEIDGRVRKMKQYTVTGMSCAACSARVEKAVSKVPGVTSCSVSLLTNSMGVEGTAAPQEIIRAVENAGYGAAEKKRGGAGTAGAAEVMPQEDMLKDRETPLLKKETGDFGRLSGSADVFFHGTYDVGMAAAGVL